MRGDHRVFIMEEQYDTYKEELTSILTVWAFNFVCSSCTVERKTVEKLFVRPEIQPTASSDYTLPPMLVCQCENILYVIRSKGLYNLLSSIFKHIEDGYILIDPYAQNEIDPLEQ